MAGFVFLIDGCPVCIAFCNGLFLFICAGLFDCKDAKPAAMAMTGLLRTLALPALAVQRFMAGFAFLIAGCLVCIAFCYGLFPFLCAGIIGCGNAKPAAMAMIGQIRTRIYAPAPAPAEKKFFCWRAAEKKFFCWRALLFPVLRRFCVGSAVLGCLQRL